MSAKEEEEESVQLSPYLEFEEICASHKEFHNDYSTFDNFSDKNKDEFFDGNLKVFSKYIYLLQFVGDEHFRDMNINYTLLGVASEYLLKMCALKINWDDYLNSYKTSSNKRMFRFVKKYVLEDLEKELKPEQYKHSEDILNFIQLQRNHFAHNPFKGMDHYAVTKQIYDLMAVLIVIYELKLPKEAVVMINDSIDKLKVLSGMDFKDVGFGEYVLRLEECATDDPLFVKW